MDTRSRGLEPGPRPAARARRTAVFKALGHPARLRIVDELAGGERCVGELVAAAGLGWSTVSKHLAVLKAAGVVDDEKRGQQVFCRLALPCVATFSACLDAARRGENVEVRTCCSRVSDLPPAAGRPHRP
jgi:ArsR family transcriptional regulator